MKTKFNQQFELAVFTEDKIICKRYFVDYNFKKCEIEFDVAIEIINATTDLIKDNLKSETLKYLWSQYNTNCSKVIKDKSDKGNMIKVVLSFNNKPFASSYISTNIYPAKIRYSIDIRPTIPEIITKIRKLLK